MWRCVDVEMCRWWRCGDVEVWRCGDVVEMWRCGGRCGDVVAMCMEFLRCGDVVDRLDAKKIFLRLVVDLRYKTTRLSLKCIPIYSPLKLQELTTFYLQSIQ